MPSRERMAEAVWKARGGTTVVGMDGSRTTGRRNRRTRQRLSVVEANGTKWISTLTKTVYWFEGGSWRQTLNVYYGKDMGWRETTIEPEAMPGFTFIELFDDDSLKDPKVIEEITLLTEQAAGVARVDPNA